VGLCDPEIIVVVRFQFAVKAMRKLHFPKLVAGLFLTTFAGVAQQWVVNQTEADIQAEIKGTPVSVTIEKPSIVAGEPLVFTVAVGNETGRDQFACVAKGCLDWTVRSPNGAVASAWQGHRSGDFAVPAAPLAPHSSKSFRVVASDTASIAAPGSYEITVRYSLGAWGGDHAKEAEPRTFTVLPRDEEALAKRTQELYDAVAHPAPRADLEVPVQALAAIRFPVAESVLCDVIGRYGLAPQYIVPRLEESGDADAVGCLIDQLAGRRKDDYWIMAALGRMEGKQADAVLRQKIKDATADACARAAPGAPWMKDACNKR
jgi:hypothetical protein